MITLSFFELHLLFIFALFSTIYFDFQNYFKAFDLIILLYILILNLVVRVQKDLLFESDGDTTLGGCHLNLTVQEEHKEYG